MELKWLTSRAPYSYKAPYAIGVFVDDGHVGTDKKLGLERFQVSVATKQLCLL